ncbi:MAG: NAD(P)H-binding protein [Deltaproteobacteria bacterium]|nr:NAD(P)H-binding protein [Deltaproteobacteria bacterium]
MGKHSVEKDSPMQKEAVLITGGSGYIGQKLIETISIKKEVVIPLYRRKIPQPQDNIYPIYADLGSKELLPAPLRGVHTVVHLAWERNFVGPKDTSSESTNLRVLSNLLDAMEKVGTRRIIFLSVIGARRESSEGFLREKYDAEHLIINSKVREKVILRSSIVYGGQHDCFVQSIKRVMKIPIFYPLPAAGGVKINPVHIDDLTGVISNLCDVKMYDSCAIMDLAGGEAYRLADLFRIVSQHFSQGRRVPLSPLLGNALVNFFERQIEEGAPRLKHFLSVGSFVEKRIRDKNPLLKQIPSQMRSFKDGFMSLSKA